MSTECPHLDFAKVSTLALELEMAHSGVLEYREPSYDKKLVKNVNVIP